MPDCLKSFRPTKLCKNWSENTARPVPLRADLGHHLLDVCELCLGDVTAFALGEVGPDGVSGAVLCLEASQLQKICVSVNPYTQEIRAGNVRKGLPWWLRP